MQKHRALTLGRLRRFATDELAPLIYPARAPITLSVWSAPDRVPYATAVAATYRPATVGEAFGPLWSTHWFKVEGEVPAAWAGREVHLVWDSGSEACVWEDGQPQQGLSGKWGFWAAHKDYRLATAAAPGQRVALFIEMACNTYFGNPSDYDPYERIVMGTVAVAELAVFDREAWDLFWDFTVVADLAQHLPADTPRGGQALRTANAIVNAFRADDRATWVEARALAAGFLSAGAGGGAHQLSAIGHAHIDTAWLWPLAETRRKCVRTFSSAVRLMDEYPAYLFACSQAQQYDWIEREHPGLFARIREKVAAGQFIPAGGTWIEPDCNIPNGESLVRQFLVGQRYFQAAFGRYCGEFWNPDVFGYSGQLPQIMRGAGIEYFLTQKLSWNQFNRPDRSTFLWEGIDGSRVLTHFPPVDNYNATATVKEVLFNVSNYKDHDRGRESYLLFGYGDGGGGPTAAMLEQLARMADVDGLPQVAQRTPAEFFARCAADIVDPVVSVGELYFELHRGTYTSQARNKRANRHSEHVLHDAEVWATIAHALGQGAYPTDDLDRVWKLVLLNQFHDIIPGSSIHEVYVDSSADYAEVLASGCRVWEQAVSALWGPDQGPNLMALNGLSFARAEVVELPAGVAGVQPLGAGRALGVLRAPSYGAGIQAKADGPHGPLHLEETDGGFVLANGHLRATLDRQGRVRSLVHSGTGRAAIASGALANRFVLFDDRPNDWDAWDVDVFHLEKWDDLPGAESAEVVAHGPLRIAVRFSHRLSANSRLVQTVSLDVEGRWLAFDTRVDWQERHRFLKVEFPLEVRAPQATYEIQFGHVQRPTHFNAQVDLARFEVPAQRWADLSDAAFGVALLNDCKYGYSTHGNVMRLSLLRAPTMPDPEADQGEHHFRYALYPHAGGPQAGGVIPAAAAFNQPLQVRRTGQAVGQHTFFAVDNPALVIDTVKKADEGDDLIVRLYEAHGTPVTARLTSALAIRAAAECDLLERDKIALAWDGGVELSLRPFEIKTLRLQQDVTHG
jgi:alpha-mannosidase